MSVSWPTPDHVHLVVRRHSYKAEIMMQQFKGNATAQLNRDARHPLTQYAEAGKAAPSPWGERGWKVYFDSEDDHLASDTICRE